ncbi:MAG: hypothetical protein R3C49_08525 [Planctomycetaceae bacterium]
MKRSNPGSASHSRKAVESSAARQLLLRAVFVCLLLMSVPGCNYFILLGYLIGGPPQLQPLFEKETKKSFTDRGVKVAVVCYASDDLTKFHDNIDYILSCRLAAHLYKHEIQVIDPDRIREWMAHHPDWDSATEVGADFDVNYVVYVDINEFSLYEPDSTSLFRGRCDAIVSVYEMETDGDGRRIFTKNVASVFPTQVPRSASDISYETFRHEYFFRLADEIGRLFYPYGNGDDIPYAN